MDTEKARELLAAAEKEAGDFGLYGFARREVVYAAIIKAYELDRAEAAQK